MTTPVSIPPENPPLKRKAAAQRPVLVITIYSWFIPILILLVFLLGIILGYFIHPSSLSPSAELSFQATPTSAEISQNQRQRIMDILAQQTQHYQGASGAAVTMYEFGDFQ